MLDELPAMAMRIDDESFTCYDLVKCMFRLSETETAILKSMEEMVPLTAGEAGERVQRDRATAYRSLEKLVSQGLVHKERRGREGRGYSNYYLRIPRRDILRKAEERLDMCYSAVKRALADAE